MQTDTTKQQVTQLLKNHTMRISPAGYTYDSLAKLPIASLRIAPEIVAKLNQLGLKSINDLLKQPRAPLARRFGPMLITRLDQALGHVPESVSPIVAVNQIIDEASAREIIKVFTEVVIAPGFTEGARKIFSSKSNLRLLTTERVTNSVHSSKVIRHVTGGYLLQDKDMEPASQNNFRVVTKRSPTDNEFKDMLFAWKVAKHVKSNAIVYARNRSTVGIGAGQMSRVDSCRIAAKKSEDMAKSQGLDELPTRGSALASDAFFPFADGLEAAIKAGASSVIQPGGSIRDDEVIKAADDAGIAMVFTGVRHFKH